MATLWLLVPGEESLCFAETSRGVFPLSFHTSPGAKEERDRMLKMKFRHKSRF